MARPKAGKPGIHPSHNTFLIIIFRVNCMDSEEYIEILRYYNII